MNLVMPEIDKRNDGAGSLILASLIFPFISCCLVLRLPELVHWFVVPVTLSGIIIGQDAIQWFRGRVNIYDPVGIVGLYGTFFFYLAPLLHPVSGYWMANVTPPNDWRTWLGSMAILNLFGLLAYRFGVRINLTTARCNTEFIFNRRKLIRVAVVLLPALAVLQLYIYQSLGGIEGYVSAAISPESDANMQGLGAVFLVSESFPAVALISLLGFSKPGTKFTWVNCALIVVGYLALAMIFGGLRGSRSNTIWSLFFAVGAIHFWIRPINKKIVVIGICFLATFMYGYGFFKAGGIEGFTKAMESPENRTEIAETHNRSSMVTLLGDLGRSDVQSYILYSIFNNDSRQFSYGLGRTYMASAALLVPSAIWPERPPTKIYEGTEALYGRGTFSIDSFKASNVYGLAGETMLNFGFMAVPISFLIWGALIGYLKRFGQSLNYSDARRILFPILINLGVVVLISDSDNILFFAFKNIAMPLAVIWLCTDRRSLK